MGFLHYVQVDKHGSDSDLPYRMAVHPGGDGLVCSFTKSCRYFIFNSIFLNVFVVEWNSISIISISVLGWVV